jgi:hypothetical protein
MASKLTPLPMPKLADPFDRSLFEVLLVTMGKKVHTKKCYELIVNVRGNKYRITANDLVMQIMNITALHTCISVHPRAANVIHIRGSDY